MSRYKHLIILFFRISLWGGGLAGVACSTTAQTPVAAEKKGSFQLTQGKRRVRDAKAILVGSLRDGPSKKPLAQLAMVVVNHQNIPADSTGHYQLEVEKGAYTIIGRNIFYENVTIKHVNIQPGDSLHVDFYLSPSQTIN